MEHGNVCAVVPQRLLQWRQMCPVRGQVENMGFSCIHHANGLCNVDEPD